MITGGPEIDQRDLARELARGDAAPVQGFEIEAGQILGRLLRRGDSQGEHHRRQNE